MSDANTICACGEPRYLHFGVHAFCYEAGYRRGDGPTFEAEREGETTADEIEAALDTGLRLNLPAREIAARIRTALVAARRSLQGELAVPGEWICDKCGFVLSTRTLNAHSGAVGVRAIVETEPCPNDGTPLRSMTWKELAEAQLAGARSLSDRLTALQGELEAARELLSAYRDKRSCDGLNGRDWDALRHYEAEQDVARMEAARAALSPQPAIAP